MKFTSKIFITGVNPYVLVPAAIKKEIFRKAGKNKGQIPVKLIIAKKDFIQTLVKYKGRWRLYLNTPMRKLAQKDVGDIIEIDIDYDDAERSTPMHPQLEQALRKNNAARKIFDSLPASRQKEILRYINSLKTKEALEKNIVRAINFLSGKERFIGRDKP